MLYQIQVLGDAVTITVSIIISLVALAVIAFLLNIFVFRQRKNKKLVIELRKKYEYVHSLLIGQDSSYIKRLELLSDVNLLMLPTYDNFNKEYETLRDYNDKLALVALEKLEKTLKENNHKILKEEYNKQRPIIIAYEKEVLTLHNSLKQVIKPEDDARQASLDVKEQLRQLKGTYSTFQTELQPLERSFNKVFANIETVFTDYERHVEVAEYEEADVLIKKLYQVVTSLKNIMTSLPDLCLRTYTIIPQKIADLDEAYTKMTDLNYPLFHLMVRSHIDAMNKTLINIDNELQNLTIRGVEESLQQMSAKIEELFAAFEKEKAKKIEYDSKYEAIYKQVNTIERKFVKLANLMPTISEIYALPLYKREAIKQIKVKINDINNKKRQLDTFVHSATRQPYSVLVEKIYELEADALSVTNELEDYNEYLSSLKLDAENAFRLIRSTYHKLKDYEYKLRQLNVPSYATKHRQKFDHCYSLIEDINATLHIQPMDVSSVNGQAKELLDMSNGLFELLEMNLNLAQLTENVIVSSNNFRHAFSEAEQKLNQYEVLFMEGQFAEAYKSAGNLLKEFWNQQ